MNSFYRFPHTPHLTWLGAGSTRDDKVLSKAETDSLLGGEILVEEKLDGANLGLSLSPGGSIRVQNRGQYLEAPYSGQFARLSAWLSLKEDVLNRLLESNLILFGEWCTARHSLDYHSLPDWFLAFDIYDRQASQFWSTTRRNELAASLAISVVPALFSGRASSQELKSLLIQTHSKFRLGPPEGIVVRKENSEWLEARAKLVHPDFTQAITEHWSRRGLVWNRLAA